MWYNADDISGTHMIFEEGGGTNGDNMYIRNSNVYVGAWSESDGYNGNWASVGTNTNNWHYLVMTYDSIAANELILYHDGIQITPITPDVDTVISEHTGDDALGSIQNDSKLDTGDVSGGLYDVSYGIYTDSHIIISKFVKNETDVPIISDMAVLVGVFFTMITDEPNILDMVTLFGMFVESAVDVMQMSDNLHILQTNIVTKDTSSILDMHR